MMPSLHMEKQTNRKNKETYSQGNQLKQLQTGSEQLFIISWSVQEVWEYSVLGHIVRVSMSLLHQH